MKRQYLVAMAVAACFAAVGIAAGSLWFNNEHCPKPSARSVAALFAPCGAFASRQGRSESGSDAGLLEPEQQPTTAAQLAQDNK
jgi:hypothetical protein